MKKVSIIIACYNHAQFLEQAVNSALNQDYPNLEVIIANDGSTDNSLEIAKKFESHNDVKIITHKNKGVVFTRNNAIDHASGDYLLSLDADDYLADNSIVSKMVKKLEADKVDLVFGNYQCFGEVNLLSKPELKPMSDLLIANFISATSLFTRKIFTKVGMYSSKMNLGYEDWEFAIKVAYYGKISKLEETIFYYRTHNVSRNTEAFKKHDQLFKQIIQNNKEIYAEYLIDIVDSFKSHSNDLKKRIKAQKKLKKYLVYCTIVSVILNLILLIDYFTA